jgi:hypothetical protein
MARVSPTLEGFRAAFRRPSLALGEITWRWVVGGTATVLFFFGVMEYLSTLPVTNGETLFLRTRQPYLVAQVILHILRGSLKRAVMSAILAGVCLALLWMIAASLGRFATVGAMLDYFRQQLARRFASRVGGEGANRDAPSRPSRASPFRTLLRLNFLRVTLAVAALVGFVGAAILAGAASPDSDPTPGLAFVLFLPLAGLVWLAWSALNWLLSLAAMFAVRDGDDAIGAISAAVSFCRKRTAAVAAVSAWTGVAHLVAFVAATTAASMALGFAGMLPGRLVALGVILVTLAYFAFADWLYTARLAGYLSIAEMPDTPFHSLPPPIAPPSERPAVPEPPPLATTIDRDEPILSDVPHLVPET